MTKKGEIFLDLVVYQIYPRSFYDFNGDGIGDLQGIKSKLFHLQDLGVNTVWICPCYPSPNADNGYDISSYTDIHPQFGSMLDWENLASALHEKNMKIIMDFVGNHTSDEHFFFQNGRKDKLNPYHDYYIWRKKPNAWKSVFGGSAWEFNPYTQEYYLHSFDKKQPDLNWENRQVRKKMQGVIDFWIGKGVDGFRCDVLDFIAKDFAQNKQFGADSLPKYIKELFGRKHTRHLFTVGECQADERSICDICGMENGKLSTIFQFDHLRIAGENKFRHKAFSFDKLKKTIVRWQNFAQEHNLILALFTDNHDYPYFISRFGDEKQRYFCATFFAAMIFLLRGIPFIYQTQEYGAINPYYEDISHFNDVESIRRFQSLIRRKKDDAIEEINVGSRDNVRRPFAWNSDEKTSFGFSKNTPWITVHSKGKEINLERDKNSPFSVFYFYRKLLAIRKQNPCLKYGKFVDKTQEKNAFVYERVYKGQKAVVICNFDKVQNITFPYDLDGKFSLLLSNYKSREKKPFARLFQPYETAVFLQN